MGVPNFASTVTAKNDHRTQTPRPMSLECDFRDSQICRFRRRKIKTTGPFPSKSPVLKDAIGTLSSCYRSSCFKLLHIRFILPRCYLNVHPDETWKTFNIPYISQKQRSSFVYLPISTCSSDVWVTVCICCVISYRRYDATTLLSPDFCLLSIRCRSVSHFLNILEHSIPHGLKLCYIKCVVFFVRGHRETTCFQPATFPDSFS